MSVDKMAERIIQIRSGGAVERCHVVRHQGSYSNAAHSWGVAMLMHALWPSCFSRLALVCLSHDVAESWVGDIPSPTASNIPGLREALKRVEGDICRDLGLPTERALSSDDLAKVKACDILDLYLWCREQYTAGNRFVGEFIYEIGAMIQKSPLPQPAQDLYEELRGREITPIQAGVMRKLFETGEDKA